MYFQSLAQQIFVHIACRADIDPTEESQLWIILEKIMPSMTYEGKGKLSWKSQQMQKLRS